MIKGSRGATTVWKTDEVEARWETDISLFTDHLLRFRAGMGLFLPYLTKRIPQCAV